MKFLPIISVLILALALSLGACKESKEAQQTDAEQEGSAPELVIDSGYSEGGNIPLGIVPNPDRFPYLEPINDTTTLMHAYSVKMKLTHGYPIAPVTNDQLKWIDADNSNELMGTFLSYVIAGRRVTLGGVNYRVDYFKKTNRGYSSLDSSFISARSYYLFDTTKARVLKDHHIVKTATGEDIHVEEYYSYRSEMYTPKYVIQGYLEYNDDYFVSFLLTTIDEFEFEDARPYYYELIKSFEMVD